MPSATPAVIGHPIANDDDAELKKKAEGVVEQIAALLTERHTAP